MLYLHCSSVIAFSNKHDMEKVFLEKELRKKERLPMRKDYLKAGLLTAGIMFFLAGCGGDFPDMTREEEQMIGEYAANVLLKYDAGNRSRLVSRELVAEEEDRRAEMKEVVEQEPVQTMDPVDDTPVIEIGQNTDADFRTGSMDEFYQLAEGVSISYQGNEICSSYSQDGTDSDYIALDAAEGKHLLVLHFTIENETGAEQLVDLLSRSTIIRVTLNGGNQYSALTTLLMNDLSTYKELVPADASAEAVLLFEIDETEGDAVTALSLQLKEEDRTCTISLK